MVLPSFPEEMSQALLCSPTWPCEEVALSGTATGPLHNRHPSHFLAMAVFGDWQKHLMSTSACVNTGFIRVVERVWMELCLARCS